MSRIDEALRQAAAVGTRRGTSLKEVPLDAAVTSVLYYPPEEPGAPIPEDAPAPRSVLALATDRQEVASCNQPFATGLAPRLVLTDADPVAIEQYRRLAATLHGLQTENGVKTLMVTSALPRDGKTLTITNLALTLSESYGRRVLLIDADLRRPSVHELLHLPNARGLSDGLAASAGDLPLVQVSANLWVLPGGRADSNPMAALTSDRMRALLEQAASQFDWVLVDTPPVGIMPDAHLLARLTDGVVFVIAAGSTPYGLVEHAVSEIGREHIVGTVLNRVEEGSNSASGYYREYYGSHPSPR